MYILVHSRAIPVHSCPFLFHSCGFLPIPVDSCGFQWNGFIPAGISGAWWSIASLDGINTLWRRFWCASPEIDSPMSMLSSTKILLKELVVYYLPYNLQYAPSSLSFWSSVSTSDTCTSMSKNWRMSGDYSLISLLWNLTKRNRTYLKFSTFHCSLTVVWLHIFEFPKIHITL